MKELISLCMCAFVSRYIFFWRVYKITKSNYELRRVCPTAWNNSAPIGWIFMKFDIYGFFESLSRIFEFD